MTWLYHADRRIALVHVTNAGGAAVMHTAFQWDGGFRPGTALTDPGADVWASVYATANEVRAALTAVDSTGTTDRPWWVVATMRHPLRRFVAAFHQTQRMGLHAYPPTAAGVASLVAEVLSPLQAELTGSTSGLSILERFFARQTALLAGADTVLRLEHLDTDMLQWAATCGRFTEAEVGLLQPVSLPPEGPAGELRVQDLLSDADADTWEWLDTLYAPDAAAGGYAWPV